MLERASEAENNLDFAGALTYYREALAREPDNPTCLSGMAGILGRMQDWNGALEYEKRLLAIDPGDARRWHGVGNILLAFLKRPKEAADAYRKATELDPTELGFHFGLMQALSLTGEHAEAISRARAILANPPSSMTPRDRTLFCKALGDAYVRAGQLPAAVSWYRKVLSLAREDSSIAADARRALEAIEAKGQ